MKEIRISVRNKFAMNLKNDTYVCGNSDYRVVFEFDEEWDDHPVKTARFKYNGMYQEFVFTGNVCEMPLIRDTRLISIGVYAGNLQTSTPAVVHAFQCILSGDAVHDDPAEDVYHQLVELVESGVLQGPDGKSAYELAVENGYIGSETDWLASLHGAPGKTPVYGVDYGTPEQIEDIVNKAAVILADDIKEISDGKVDKVKGMGLSSNDYDNTAKAKVEAIPEDPKYTDTVYDDTEVKQSLNHIMDDLSNKLPKSPANWEPWTAEEKAAARERIGIPGDYELIADIMIDEDVENIVLSKDSSGADLSLTDFVMIVTMEKCDQETRKFVKVTSNNAKNYVIASQIFATSTYTKGYTYIEFHLNKGSFCNGFSTHGSGGDALIKSIMTDRFDIKLTDIGKIETNNLSGQYIKAGTKIIIYGVRV